MLQIISRDGYVQYANSAALHYFHSCYYTIETCKIFAFICSQFTKEHSRHAIQWGGQMNLILDLVHHTSTILWGDLFFSHFIIDMYCKGETRLLDANFRKWLWLRFSAKIWLIPCRQKRTLSHFWKRKRILKRTFCTTRDAYPHTLIYCS